MPRAAPPLDLSVVIPAFDEEAAIRGVVEGWDATLSGLGLRYEIRVYDDGSRDRTGTVLAELARERPRVVAVGQANRGHGPTVLRGYREALGAWVFQVDGDNEMGPGSFATLWAARDDADVLLGYRVGRVQTAGRRLISAVSRAAVALLFGRRVRDVNVPYRLHRRAVLDALLPCVPDDTFAPNVAIVGLAIRAGFRIREFPVPHEGRRTGRSSITRLRMWRAAARSLRQTVAIALRARGAVRP